MQIKCHRCDGTKRHVFKNPDDFESYRIKAKRRLITVDVNNPICLECNGTGEIQEPFDMLLDVADEAFREMISPVPGIRLPLWNRFNNLTGGFRPREVTLVCAPTGIGKTQWLSNVSAQLLMLDIPHFVASVETGRHDYVRRMASAIARKDYNDGEPIPEAEIQLLVQKYSGLWKKNNIAFARVENRIEADRMLSLLHLAKERRNIRIAILDNLNFFMKIVSSQMEKAEMDEAIHNFVIESKEIDVHTILVVHPRKTDGGRVESEFDIKGSSTAVQECANVMLMNRPTEKDIENGNCQPWDREFKFAKLRKRGINVGTRLYFGYDNGQYIEKSVQTPNGKWENQHKVRSLTDDELDYIRNPDRRDIHG